ncbi:transglutaminase-like cysteine peptidase [Rhizobium sp. AAP43]|uniref:transglutaminase-like cysteine peptidase n=1 Tax=Rhizobium sp. AAP43 TaxID=1523420 RepID=UPI0006B96F67|nr:transglutaminase-like cysteine peptidase [Rhizobium sp. AAP43]
MLKKKKNIVAASTLALATFFVPGAQAAPAPTGALVFHSSIAQALLLGLNPLSPSISEAFSQRIAKGWQNTRQIVETQALQMQTVALAAPVDGGVLTGAIAAKSPTTPRRTTQADGVFGSVAIPFKKLGALKKAASTFGEIAKGTALNCKGRTCTDLGTLVHRTSDGGAKASVRDTLNLVNAEVNRKIEYRKDLDVHGRLDQWSSPSQTLARGTGDCEDYALLKMAMLAEKGIALEDMTVVILYDKKRHFYHAILSVEVGGNNYILDNMRNQVLADRQLPDYQPLFSISNGRGFLHGIRKGAGKALAMKSLDSIAPGEGGEL